MSELRTCASVALSLLAIASCTTTSMAQHPDETSQSLRSDPASQPSELGDVRWYRKEAIAQQQAKASGKPLLVLFQEVPG